MGNKRRIPKGGSRKRQKLRDEMSMCCASGRSVLRQCTPESLAGQGYHESPGIQWTEYGKLLGSQVSADPCGACSDEGLDRLFQVSLRVRQPQRWQQATELHRPSRMARVMTCERVMALGGMVWILEVKTNCSS